MRAFISYSFNDRDLPLLTSLASKLREDGYSVDASTYNVVNGNEIAPMAQSHIRAAHVFIGIITQTGKMNTNVHNEWQFARNSGVPALLLVERGIPIPDGDTTIIQFSRTDSQSASTLIQRERDNAVHSYTQQQSGNNTALAWILGGAAAILALNVLSSQGESRKKISAHKRKNIKKRAV